MSKLVKVVELVNLSELTENEYERISFCSCDFSFVTLRGIRFTDCEFVDCNFSMTKFVGVTLHHALFKNCKAMGTDFTGCTGLTSFRFENSQLRNSLFEQMKLPHTEFYDCDLSGVAFDQADFSCAEFVRCQLAGATFGATNLMKANFVEAYGYVVDIRSAKLKGAHFSRDGLAGLLTHLNIKVE